MKLNEFFAGVERGSLLFERRGKDSILREVGVLKVKGGEGS